MVHSKTESGHNPFTMNGKEDTAAPHDQDLLRQMGFCPENCATIQDGAQALAHCLRKIAIANDMSEEEVYMQTENETIVMFEACPENVYRMSWAYHACDGLITCPGKWHCEAVNSFTVVFVDDTE